jgi:ArsR family transcriptional regulator, lead/cadmium/zinc/bismuth-responsive transcriptional repressor
MKNRKDINTNDLCMVRTVHIDRIKQAGRESIPESHLLRLASIFKVMGDPTRLRIITALQGGEMCVCDLAAYLNLTESAVSHQLRRLRELNLIKNRREGQILFYSLDDNHVEDLLKIGLEHVTESRTP